LERSRRFPFITFDRDSGNDSNAHLRRRARAVGGVSDAAIAANANVDRKVALTQATHRLRSPDLSIDVREQRFQKALELLRARGMQHLTRLMGRARARLIASAILRCDSESRAHSRKRSESRRKSAIGASEIALTRSLSTERGFQTRDAEMTLGKMVADLGRS
jgi:hypothetical protein